MCFLLKLIFCVIAPGVYLYIGYMAREQAGENVNGSDIAGILNC